MKTSQSEEVLVKNLDILLQYLSFKDVCKLERVNKTFQGRLSRDKVWEYLIIKNFRKNFEEILDGQKDEESTKNLFRRKFLGRRKNIAKENMTEYYKPQAMIQYVMFIFVIFVVSIVLHIQFSRLQMVAELKEGEKIFFDREYVTDAFRKSPDYLFEKYRIVVRKYFSHRKDLALKQVINVNTIGKMTQDMMLSERCFKDIEKCFPVLVRNRFWFQFPHEKLVNFIHRLRFPSYEDDDEEEEGVSIEGDYFEEEEVHKEFFDFHTIRNSLVYERSSSDRTSAKIINEMARLSNHITVELVNLFYMTLDSTLLDQLEKDLKSQLFEILPYSRGYGSIIKTSVLGACLAIVLIILIDRLERAFIEVELLDKGSHVRWFQTLPPRLYAYHISHFFTSRKNFIILIVSFYLMKLIEFILFKLVGIEI